MSTAPFGENFLTVAGIMLTRAGVTPLHFAIFLRRRTPIIVNLQKILCSRSFFIFIYIVHWGCLRALYDPFEGVRVLASVPTTIYLWFRIFLSHYSLSWIVYHYCLALPRIDLRRKSLSFVGVFELMALL